MLFVVMVLSLVGSAIRPLVSTESMLLIIDPVTSINGSIGIAICTLPVHFIMPPNSNVDIAVSESISANTVLLGVDEVSLVTGAVNKLLKTFTLSLITYPISVV